MVRDELNEPLGYASGEVGALPAGLMRTVGQAALAAAALAASIGLARVAGRESPLGGEPFAVAKVEVAPPARPPASDTTPTIHEVAARPISSADQVEAASGVKVTRAGGGGPPDAPIIDVERALAVRLDAAPDSRLIETSRYGPLPRIGADGARPFEVYARPAPLDQKLQASAPRIALMVGDLGLNAEGAEAAIAKLPGAVTLGFAPNGGGIKERAAEARDAGHETVLEASMEDFSDGADDPRPHTLKASASDGDNLDSLRWLMSRFTGYVAVVNRIGGKFTADAKEISPILTEIAARGLGYLDDGASPRSIAPDVAATLAMPSARADLIIDADPTPEAIDAALARLLDRARERGRAIGVASDSPMSVERLAIWANGLEAKGVALVPLSALMSAAPSLSPQTKR
jgi:polysaccharide deacetylase 2 family uncharacterized protein YibQ